MTDQKTLKRQVRERMERTGESYTAALWGIKQGKPEVVKPGHTPKAPGSKPAANQHQQGIRERQARTGETYTEARRGYLAERNLPAQTATSRVTAQRRAEREAEIVAEYGEHLGIDGLPGADAGSAVPPQLDEPRVEVRRAGRVR